MSAGKNIPPKAASTGNDAFLKVESSPVIISRFISKPTNRKKTAIKPSLIQVATLYLTLENPITLFSKAEKIIGKYRVCED